MRIQHHFFTGFYLVLVGLPLLAYNSTLSRRPLLDELASGMAILALSMIMFEFLLSGRFKTLSAPVGMDTVMRFHQFTGRVILGFILLHPLLYSLPYNHNLPWDNTRSFSLNMSSVSAICALVALTLVCLLVVLAIGRKHLTMRYEQWRVGHLLISTVVVVLGLIHAFESGRYTQLTDLWLFWLAGSIVVLLALLHVYLFVPLKQNRQPYYVHLLEPLNETTWCLRLKSKQPPLPFQAGQFAWLKFGRPFFNFQEHPFSISSAPTSGYLEFTIKSLGDFTSQLDKLDRKQPIYVDGPYGHFTLNNRSASGIMLIAGGIGIAPVMSIIRDLAAKRDRRPILLLYCCRDEQQLVYAQELEQLREHLVLTIVPILSSPCNEWRGCTGRVDQELLKSLLAENHSQWCYFVCGPAAMMYCVEMALIHLHVPRDQIISEHFSYEYHKALE